MSASQTATIKMRLDGARRVTLEAEGTAAAVNKVAAATTRAGLAAKEATHHSFLYSQAMFTLRRGVYALTLVTAAAATGIVGFGLKFNASMQQNEIAMEHFLGTNQLAKDLLEDLFDLAAHTPFEFQGLVDSTKQLLAMGYTGEQAYRTMVDIGDAVAGLGSGAQGIDRLTLAFGQMRTNGRILGGELRQLGEAGINARKYLQEAFQLTTDQMAHIGQLGIPAAAGIEAILQGMEKEFGGLAQKEAGTFMGLLSTIHDYSERLFGRLTEPLFLVLSTKYLPQLAEDVQELGEAFETGGWDKFARTLDEQVGASGNLVRAFNLLEAYGRVLWVFLKDSLWPVSRDIVVIFGLFAYVILQTMLPALRFLTDHSTLLKVVMFTLITYFAIAKVRAIQLAIAETRLWGATALLAGWTRAVVIWTRREIAVWGLARIRLIAVTYATAAYMTATRLLTAALLMMNITLEATPVGWILTALALIAVALYILIFHFDKVKAAAKAVWEWVMDHKILTAILLGPIGIWLAAVVVAIALVISKLKDMIGWAKKAWGWVKDIWNSVPGANLAEGAVGFIASHASGGMMGKAGLSLVGEQGPELVSLPAGATIKNRSQTRLDPEHQGMISLALTSIVEIDRREIARAYQNYTLDQAARA